MISINRARISFGPLLLAIFYSCFVYLCFSMGSHLNAQEEAAVDPKTKYKRSPAVYELVRLSESWDTSRRIGALRALKELAMIRSSRLANDAARALADLKLQALKWGKPFIVKELKHSITVNAEHFSHNDLVNLQLLEPESLAFVDMPGFDDNNLTVLDRMSSLENLTIQNCPLVDGSGFRGIRLPNLQILNLRGSKIGTLFVKSLHPTNLPELEFIDLRGTGAGKDFVHMIRNQMKKGKNEIHVLTD